jgi:hypothetical protein
MVIRIEAEGKTVEMRDEDVVTWTEAVEMFVSCLNAVGFVVKDFSFNSESFIVERNDKELD